MTKKDPKKKSIENSKKKVLKEIEISGEETAGLSREGEKKKTGEKADPGTSKKSWSGRRKEKRAEKKAVRKQRKLRTRILIFLGKTVFIRIPVLVILLLVIALITAKIYLSPQRVENLITTNFNRMSYGEISLNVREFSPYGGFIIENIHIKNGKEFNNSTFVKIKRLAVKYGFFPIFIGSVKFPEIGIYKPEIYLEERNGVWNAARLMKPGEKKPEEEKEKKKPEEKEGPPQKEINLPLSVEFLLNFILDDLKLYARSSAFNTSMEGLSFNLGIDIPPFKKIPLSVDAVTLLRKLNIVLNPKEEMKVAFSSKEAGLAPPLILTWKLIFSKEEKNTPLFNSIFKFGTYRAPVRFRKTYLAPLNFMVSYDLFYNPLEDHLSLKHFGVQFAGKKWLYLTGSISHVTKKQKIDLRMAESSISLNDLYPYFLSLTGDRSKRFGGTISLMPLTITGGPENIDLAGNLVLRNIFFSMPKTAASIPYLNLSYDMKKRSSTMMLSSLLRIPGLYYSLNGKRSGSNGIEMKIDVTGYNMFASAVAIRNFGLKLYSPQAKTNALDLTLQGNVKLAPALSGKVVIKKFRFNQKPLLVMLPVTFRPAIEGIPLTKPVDMNLDLNFALGDRISALLNMFLKVPGLNAGGQDLAFNDLKLNLNVLMDNKKKFLNLKRFHFGSKMWNLSVDAGGTLNMKKAPFSDSNLRFALTLNNPVLRTILPPWQIGGLVDLRAYVKGDLETGKAWGSFRIDKFNLRNDSPGQMLAVTDVNLDFPFEMPFEYIIQKKYKGESLLTVNKDFIFNNENFMDKPNFTIKSIKAKHPARKVQFEYLKDFEASLFFRKNLFQISNMKAYVLDGSLYGRRILFNLADMTPDNMEFMLIMDITNVDINKLAEPDPKKKTREAELSLNANFSGRGLNIKKELKPVGYINIYKIGDEFASRLFKGLSEEKGESKIGVIGDFVVKNSVKPIGFNFNLDKGLVYATVLFKNDSIIGLGIGIENNKIPFDRMPLQEYLRNIMAGDEKGGKNETK